jgi:hypothetical protein
MTDKIITAILIVIVIIIMLYTDFSGHRVVVYDCRMSEISPDYPRSVVEECRRLQRDGETANSMKGTI